MKTEKHLKFLYFLLEFVNLSLKVFEINLDLSWGIHPQDNEYLNEMRRNTFDFSTILTVKEIN